jgi:hypothetical protein
MNRRELISGAIPAVVGLSVPTIVSSDDTKATDLEDKYWDAQVLIGKLERTLRGDPEPK